MNGRLTFTIIKPDAVQSESIGPILNMFHDNDFHIAAMKLTRLTKVQAEKFYDVHKGKAFFEDLIKFMTSGPIVVAILEKDNAVDDYRKLIGSTNPEKAEPGTIRKLYAKSMKENAVHGSDSDENAEIECNFYFATCERFYKEA